MKKILLVVDYQNDFVDGSLGFQKAVLLDSKIASRMNDYKNDIIICTKDVHDGNYLQTQEGKNLPIMHCMKGRVGSEFYGEVNKMVEIVRPMVILKNTFGSLALTRALKEIIKDNKAEIEICGVVTNICVMANAVLCKTAVPEAVININADLCASFDDVLHEKALVVMESLQMNIIRRK